MNKFSCLITDYQGDDCNYEVSELSNNGVETIIANSKDTDDWIRYVEGVDAVLTRHAVFDKQVLDLMSQCKVIARYGTGYDNIDIASAKKKNIIVTYVDEYCADEVAEHTFSLILYAARNLSLFVNSVREGGWTPVPLPPIGRLNGKKITIVGYGKIGRKVARRALAFGLSVRVYDPYVSEGGLDGVTIYENIEEALTGTDIVSLHVPLIDETRHILNEERLNLISKGGVVVNVSRGGLVDVDSAIRLLDKGKLNFVGLDVLEKEPPEIGDIIRTHPKIILTPHVGYYSHESIAASKAICVQNILSVLKGDSPAGPLAD
tara:strand:- start:2189 stop:3145 length:957 start_codon:yes stop_codon:yes gene_type:complete